MEIEDMLGFVRVSIEDIAHLDITSKVARDANRSGKTRLSREEDINSVKVAASVNVEYYHLTVSETEHSHIGCNTLQPVGHINLITTSRLILARRRRVRPI